MNFITTILAALKWKAGAPTVEALTGIAYRATFDTTSTHRAYVDSTVTHRARIDTRVTHRVEVDARG